MQEIPHGGHPEDGCGKENPGAEERRRILMKMEVERDGKLVKVSPEDLTNLELCGALANITIDGDEFLSKQEIEEGYAAINEARRRLRGK